MNISQNYCDSDRRTRIPTHVIFRVEDLRRWLIRKEIEIAFCGNTQERLRGIHVPNKVYSFHEAHVACIRKGKRATPNEYGTKLLISIDSHGYVDHQEYASNPQHSELLEEACQRWEKTFDRPAKELGAGRGFHVNQCAPTPHLAQIEKVALPTKGKKPHPHKENSWFKRLQGKEQR